MRKNMKFLFLAFLCLFLEKKSTAQQNEVRSIVPPSYYFINSAIKSQTANHYSRLTIPFELPKNTVAWYYSVQAWREEKDVEQVKQQMKLLSNLVKLVPTVGTISAFVLDNAFSTTADFCHVYVLDENSYSDFTNKKDLDLLDNDKSFLRKYRRANSENATKITKTITDAELLKGKFYLGIINPDLTNGIKVMVEVVAVVSNPEGGSSTVVANKSTVNTNVAQNKKVSQMDQAEETLDKDAKKMGVFSYAPILENPDIVNSRQIGQARNNYVVILRQVSDKYYYVKNGKVEGYLFVAFLNP